MILSIAALLTSISLCSPPSTEIHYTRDLDFQIPFYTNAPRFLMNRSLRPGRIPIENPKRKVKKKTDPLLNLLLDEYGDEYTTIRWRGSIIIRRKKF